jgi:hypothetical protein
MEERLFNIAARIVKPISLVSLIVIVVYLLYKLILGLDIFSDLAEDSSLLVITSIIDKVFYLALVTLILGIVAYLFTKFIDRSENTKPNQISIIGNVFTSSGRPVRGANISVDGVDRRKETDISGWFQIAVNPYNNWTIRASYRDEFIHKEISIQDLNEPIKLVFDKELEIETETEVNDKRRAVLTPEQREFARLVGLQHYGNTRYADYQLKAYSSIWKELQDMKTFADDLWDRATEKRLYLFTLQQIKTEKMIAGNAIFFAEDDYRELQKILQVFGSFKIGKEKIIEIRSRAQFRKLYDVFESDLIAQIEMNGQFKQQYDALLERIRISFRERLISAVYNYSEQDVRSAA